jgi:hypothetical protein
MFYFGARGPGIIRDRPAFNNLIAVDVAAAFYSE